MWKWLAAPARPILLAAVLAACPMMTVAQQPTEVDQLKATVEALQRTVQETLKELDARTAAMESLQKTVDALNARIAALENEKVPPAQTPPHPLAETAAPSPQAQAVPAPRPGDVATHVRSQIPDYQNFSDHQTPAPRPDNVPLDPDLKGFIPIPGTQSMIRIGGAARVDAIENFGNNGNPNLFLLSSMPVDGQLGFGGPGQFGMQAKGTRISFDIRRSGSASGPFRVYYENDFYNDSSSPAMSYRLRHLYGQGNNFLLGQTYTAFMNPDAFPDTVDYIGPNAMVDVRQPQVRIVAPLSERQHMTFSLEQPNSQIATSDPGYPAGASPINRYPDLALNYRFVGQGGHLQIAGLARSLGFDAPAAPERTVLGWGLSLSGALNFPGKDRFSFQAAYGEGIARYIKDTVGLNLDAGLDARGRLKAIPVFAPMIGYTHQWTERWRSTATYGYVRVDPPASMGPWALRNTRYASLNVMWQPTKASWMGLEYLYGTKETMNGAEGTANRLNLVFKYDLVK